MLVSRWQKFLGRCRSSRPLHKGRCRSLSSRQNASRLQGHQSELLPLRTLLTRVTTFDPLADSSAVPNGTDIAATIDAAIDGGSVTDQTFVVHGGQTGQLLTANGSTLSTSGSTVSLNPALDLKAGELVQVTATAGIPDTGATAIDPFVWQFRAAVGGGTGVFINSGQLLGNATSQNVSLGDLDSDGDLDAFVAVAGGSGNLVWLNQGGAQGGTPGVFSDSGQTLGSFSTIDVSLGDVDGEGDLDAFTANYAQPNRVWVNQGGAQGGTAGVFSNSGQAPGTDYSTAVSPGDVDSDGDLDAFVAGSGGNRVWLNQGSAQQTTPSVFSAIQTLGNSDGYGVALGDVDGNGDLNAFVANRTEPNTLWLNQNPSVDLSVTKTSGQVAAVQGSEVTYTIVLTGDAGLDVSGVTVTDEFPIELTEITWTTSTAGGAAGGAAGGTGDINTVVDSPAGSTVTFTVTATVRTAGAADQAAAAILTSPVTLTIPDGLNNVAPDDNSASDSDVLVLGTGHSRMDGHVQ